MEFLPFTRPSIDEDTIAAVGEVLRSGWITTGPYAKKFEEALSTYVGGRPVRIVTSATAALKMALQIAGIKEGDEVITTPLSWIATANVILDVGATPVFVDSDFATRNINLDLIEAAITEKTKAILPVDLAGLPVNRDKLYALATKYKLRVIEDAAQSMGANWGGSLIGVKGDLISFSFHANKNMTSCEGGCLVLNNEEEARHFEKLRLQGVTRFSDGTMDVDLLGGKANMTDVASVIGLKQLSKLDDFNEKRRALAAQYFAKKELLAGCDLPIYDLEQSNWHMFQLLLPKHIIRADFIEKMKEQGIGIGVHYPAMHLFTLFKQYGFKAGDYPVSEDIGARTVTLPLFPAMQLSDVDRVCIAINKVIN